MKKNIKRVISLLLCIVLLGGILPLAILGASAGSNTHKAGDVIVFGSYPQTDVTDEMGIILEGLVPDDTTKWKSYNYFSGDAEDTSDLQYGTMKSSSYMRYIDVTYVGVKYRAVVFDAYRPKWTMLKSSKENSYQYNNGYEPGNIYWFRFDPVKWTIFDYNPAENSGLVICNTIIDSQPLTNLIYENEGDFYNDSGLTNFASDYPSSTLRQWLGSDFCNTTFTSSEKSIISGDVSLLSYEDVSKVTQVFSDCDIEEIYATDYAKCQGIYCDDNDKCYWTLNGQSNSSDRCCYNTPGGPSKYGYAFYTSQGTVPVMNLDLSDVAVLLYNTDPDEMTGTSVKIFTPYYPECPFTNSNGKTFSGWYKDSSCSEIWTEDDIVTCSIPIYAGWTDLEYGDTITLGRYEQDNNLDNGPEPIEWIVLDPGTGLCISKNALDVVPFNFSKDDKNNYEDSFIREWLYSSGETDSFYGNAFTEKEKSAIRTKDITTFKYGSDSEKLSMVRDKVFLLSVQEANKYFDPYTEGKCIPTEFAIENGADYRLNGCWWWLRSPGIDEDLAAEIVTDGTVHTDGYYINQSDICVRPAIYVNLHSDSVLKYISPDMVDKISDCTYTGAEQTPGATITDGNKTLVYGTDYTITYKNNINAGTAVETIKGIKGYKGDVRKTFNIKPASISEAVITLNPEQATYTGEEIEPSVTVTFPENRVLEKDTDYTVEYFNNVNAGTATVKVTGKSNYTNVATETFKINPASQAAPSGIGKTDETKCSESDGTITGTAATMEFAFERGEYKPCKGTEITGLAPGTYHVRYAADNDHTASDAVQIVIGKGTCYGGKATCTAKAVCDGCGSSYGDIDPDNHAYNNVKYTWSKSYDACQATFICDNDAKHTKNVSCKVVKEITTQPSCTDTGEYTCTAKVEFEGKEYSDIQKYPIPKTDHNTVLKYDSTNHWMECDCGYIENTEAHKDSDNDLKCDVCGYDLSQNTEIRNFPESAGIPYGKTLQIKAESNHGRIIYTSSNPEVASVDENGNVTANYKGECVITAQIEGTDIKQECRVTVNMSFLDMVLYFFAKLISTIIAKLVEVC